MNNSKPGKRGRLFVLMTAVAALGIVLCYAGIQESRHENRQMPQYRTLQLQALTEPVSVRAKDKTPAQVYAENVHAVVGIRTESTVTNIFGQPTSASCSGSGFLISNDGYVVTNYHVVSGANTIIVSLYSGEDHPARLVGGYAENDVALLKIDGTDLPHVTIGRSDELVVGEQVVAIGNPLGELTYSMTVGYISALDRAIHAAGVPINMLQTDVAINSGNSGGPLFDMSGKVIGIASAKYSGKTGSGAYIEGLSFAIPMDDVFRILHDLGRFGYVTGPLAQRTGDAA